MERFEKYRDPDEELRFQRERERKRQAELDNIRRRQEEIDHRNFVIRDLTQQLADTACGLRVEQGEAWKLANLESGLQRLQELHKEAGIR